MTPEDFLNNFRILAEAPEGINRLRELVLGLATQGLLVPQSASDEPAEIALRQRHETRLRMWRERHGTKPPPFSQPSQVAELPRLPLGWSWEKIENLGANPFAAVQTGPFGSQLLKTEFVPSGVPVIAVGNIGYLSFKNDGRFFITPSKAESLGRYSVQAGDLLFARTGSVGKVCVAPDYVNDWRMTGHILRLRLYTSVANPRFIAFALRGAKSVQEQVSEGIKGTTRPGFNTSLLERIVVPIPPFAEQQRIVAKVDQLMALCDELEIQQTKQQKIGSRLTLAALEALTREEEPEASTKAWQRVTQHFEALFDRRENVGQLRKAILGLAVRGKLVPQHQDEEPAAKLLEDVRPSVFIKSTKKTNNGPETTLNGSINTGLFPLPLTWQWAVFTEIASIDSCLVDPSEHADYPHIAPDNIEKGTGQLLPYRTIREDQVTSPKHHFLAGQLLYSKIRPNLSKAAIVDFEGLCSADMYPITSRINTRYLLICILSDVFLSQVVRGDNRLAMPKVNQQQLSVTILPVPPLAEQERIASRVEQLMTLCGDLESRLRKAELGAQHLAEAMSEEMVSWPA